MAGPAAGTPAAEPPSKRRRVLRDGKQQPHDGDDVRSSPDPLTRDDDAFTPRRLSIRNPRPPPTHDKNATPSAASAPPSRTRSPDSSPSPLRSARPTSRSGPGPRPRSPSLSRTRSRSRSPHSRSPSSSPNRRSPSRSRSRSISRSRRTGDHSSASRSPSRSRSRSPTSRSRSRSRSGSPSPYRSRSGSSSHSPYHSPPGEDVLQAQVLQQQQQQQQQQQKSPKPEPAQVKIRYRPRLELKGHMQPISQVRISPDGRWIASASADGTARVWDAASGAHIDTLVGHMAGVSCLAWSPDSGTLATGSDDKAIRLWDRISAEPAHGVDVDGDEDENEENARRGRPRATNGARRKEASAGPSAAAAVARGSRRPLLGHHNYVYCLAFSPKGNILASGSYDEAVFLWDVRAGRLMRSLPAHSDPVSGIDFCRDGTLVVSCSTDGLIRIWDTSTGQCLRTLVHEDNPAVSSVCFSPNGRYVLAFNLDSCIRLWDYITQPSTVKKTYQGHLNKGFSIGGCFGAVRKGDENTDDNYRVPNSGADLIDDEEGDDGDDNVDVLGGEEDIDSQLGLRRRLNRRQGRGSSRQQALVASASEDGDVLLWDVGSKEVVQRIAAAHDGVCFWVDIVGDTMVSAGKDGRIVVYHNGRVARRQKPAAAAQQAEETAVGKQQEDQVMANGTNNGGDTEHAVDDGAMEIDDADIQAALAKEADALAA